MVSPSPTASAVNAYRILVVEDDADIARLILKALSGLGLECRYAADGTAGWEAFDTMEPHLVLLDVNLPGINGYDLCARMREQSTVPIIMMTAMDAEEQQLQGFKIGADDYVPKPFNPKLLVARVVAQLRRVYRYDVQNCEALQRQALTAQMAAATDAVSNKPKMRPGWAQCESCGYMGPREKFDKENALGTIQRVCPNCRERDFIVFAIA
jgi:DNA-binding response OmpR family regulator